ncbi:MAG: hypothetical protein PHR28_13705 [candidate division Zixibacteria bacterium]|nr:hypothetical protein [candidate division Zixibacteria bacterium]
MNDVIKCYTSGRPLAEGNNIGTVSFAIPDYGILFRCRGEGTRTELEIIAFMSLLRFAEANKELFHKKELLIHTDFPFIVYLLNDAESATGKMGAVATRARQYAKEFIFQAVWVDPRDNRAAAPILDLPDLPAESGQRLKSFLRHPDPHQASKRPRAAKPDLF